MASSMASSMASKVVSESDNVANPRPHPPPAAWNTAVGVGTNTDWNYPGPSCGQILAHSLGWLDVAS